LGTSIKSGTFSTATAVINSNETALSLFAMDEYLRTMLFGLAVASNSASVLAGIQV
jgi:hypothetical protein